MSVVRFDPVALRAARLRAGLTQAAVAEAVGFSSDAQVWRWEHGRDEPGPKAMPLLANLLGVPMLELFDVGEGPVPLRLLRRIAGLTLMDVARRTGISYTRYRGIETGAVTARLGEVARLADPLGVGVQDIWRSLGGMPPVTPPRR